MSLQDRYYHDWTAPETGIRYRLIFTPKAAVRIDTGGEIVANEAEWGTPPAFDADPVDGSGWLRIPSGVVYDVKIPEYGWDLPIGFHSDPQLQLTLKTEFLEAHPALAGMPGYLSEPAFDVHVSELVANPGDYGTAALEVSPGLYRLLNTSNLYTLLGDQGDSGLVVGEFACLFVGGHDRVGDDGAEQTHAVTAEGTEISLSLTHVFWLAAAMVYPADVAARVGMALPTEVHSHLWDVVWHGTTFRYARVLGSHPGADDPEEYDLRSLGLIYTTITDLVASVITAFTRTQLTALIVESETGPYEGLVLREQLQVTENFHDSGLPLAEAGEEITVPYVLGWVRGQVSGDEFGGYLSELGGAETTLFAWDNMIQLLIAASEGCVQKATVSMPDALTINLRDLGVLESLADLALGVTGWSQTVVEFAAGVVSGADAEIPGAQDGDVSRITYRIPNVRDTGAWTVPVVFHTQPHVGTEGSVWYGNLTRGSTGLEQTWQVIGSPPVLMNVLWYIGPLLNNAGVSVGVSVPLRVHHYVGIRDGATTYNEVTNGVALPDPGDLPNDEDEPWLTDLWRPARLALIEMQQAGNVGAAVARVSARFGDRRQSVFPGEVSVTEAGPEQMGRRADASWSSTADFTGKSYHTGPGRPLLTATSHDATTGRASVKLLALP